jgi:erythromycin esterase-like protein
MKIRKEDKLLVAADKTRNFYHLDAPSYKQLVNTAITKSYKKAHNNNAAKIISTEKKIAENINLDNRIDALTARHAFITLKDHKPNFQNNPTCRLINPAKSEIAIISQKVLQRINSACSHRCYKS